MAISSFRNISVATALLIAIYGHTGMVAEASDLDEVIEQPANDAGPASSAAVGNDMWFGMVTDVDSQASTFRLNESVFEWKSLAPWSLHPEVGQSFLIAGRFESTNRTYQAFALYDAPEENIIPNGKIPQARLSSLGGGSLLVAEPFRQSALHGGNTAGIHGGNVAGIHGGNTAGIHGGNVAGIHGGNTAGIHGGNYH